MCSCLNSEREISKRLFFWGFKRRIGIYPITECKHTKASYNDVKEKMKGNITTQETGERDGRKERKK